MKPPLFVKNQETNIRRSFSLRMLFNLLFVTSLGLNVYFLVSQNELSSVANAYNVGLKEKEIAEGSRIGSHSVVLQSQSLDSGLKTNIHEEDPTQNFNSVEAPPYKVEQVLFDSSTQSNEPNIQALKLKVKNSLSYTVCQGVKLRSECDAFAAHLARLLVWFLDVNKEMRNGDDLSVVYERLDNQGQFKILQLIYKSSYLKKRWRLIFTRNRE